MGGRVTTTRITKLVSHILLLLILFSLIRSNLPSVLYPASQSWLQSLLSTIESFNPHLLNLTIIWTSSCHNFIFVNLIVISLFLITRNNHEYHQYHHQKFAYYKTRVPIKITSTGANHNIQEDFYDVNKVNQALYVHADQYERPKVKKGNRSHIGFVHSTFQSLVYMDAANYHFLQQSASNHNSIGNYSYIPQDTAKNQSYLTTENSEFHLNDSEAHEYVLYMDQAYDSNDNTDLDLKFSSDFNVDHRTPFGNPKMPFPRVQQNFQRGNPKRKAAENCVDDLLPCEYYSDGMARNPQITTKFRSPGSTISVEMATTATNSEVASKASIGDHYGTDDMGENGWPEVCDRDELITLTSTGASVGSRAGHHERQSKMGEIKHMTRSKSVSGYNSQKDPTRSEEDVISGRCMKLTEESKTYEDILYGNSLETLSDEDANKMFSDFIATHRARMRTES